MHLSDYHFISGWQNWGSWLERNKTYLKLLPSGFENLYRASKTIDPRIIIPIRNSTSICGNHGKPWNQCRVRFNDLINFNPQRRRHFFKFIEQNRDKSLDCNLNLMKILRETWILQYKSIFCFNYIVNESLHKAET